MNERTDLHLVRPPSTVCIECWCLVGPADPGPICARCVRYAELARMTQFMEPGHRHLVDQLVALAVMRMDPADAGRMFGLMAEIVAADH
jgi:hypothetical protein